jgi:hypothetical protein
MRYQLATPPPPVQGGRPAGTSAASQKPRPPRANSSTLRSMKKLLPLLIMCAVALAVAQQQAAPAPAADVTPELVHLVQTEFGDGFKIEMERLLSGFRYQTTDKEQAAWDPVHAGDLNGDGVEDIVIVARSSSPLGGQISHKYKVIDPYFAAHGFGDPRVSAEFQTEDPRYAGQVVLVIHGTGEKAWRSDAPKEKFVIINLPFKDLSIRPIAVKKKTFNAIFAAEESGGTSAIFWEKKKYRWIAQGFGG